MIGNLDNLSFGMGVKAKPYQTLSRKHNLEGIDLSDSWKYLVGITLIVVLAKKGGWL